MDAPGDERHRSETNIEKFIAGLSVATLLSCAVLIAPVIIVMGISLYIKGKKNVKMDS